MQKNRAKDYGTQIENYNSGQASLSSIRSCLSLKTAHIIASNKSSSPFIDMSKQKVDNGLSFLTTCESCWGAKKKHHTHTISWQFIRHI